MKELKIKEQKSELELREVRVQLINVIKNKKLEMNLAKCINCVLCNESCKFTDSSFRKQIQLCNLCYETYKYQYKSEWTQDKYESYKSCPMCLKGVSDNLVVLKHDCCCKNVFLCNECNLMFDRKTDVVKHITKFNCQFNLNVFDSENWVVNCNVSCDKYKMYYSPCNVNQNETNLCKQQIRKMAKTNNYKFYKKLNDQSGTWHCDILGCKKPYKCKHCEKLSTTKGGLTVHSRTHSGKKSFKCKHCDKSFSASGGLTIHLRTHSGEKPFKCKHCDKLFSQSGGLTVHLRTHSGEKPFKCNHCDKSFSTSGYLTVHLRTHSGEKPFKCKLCGKSFIDSGTLSKHLRIHSHEKPYKCKHCDNSFTKLVGLKNHLYYIHSGDKPYKCNHCNKSFIESYDLKRHLRIHSGEKPYKCKHCDKSFTRSENLTRHLRIHSGEKPYICKYCNKTFNQSGNLNVHLRIHSRRKNYKT